MSAQRIEDRAAFEALLGEPSGWPALVEDAAPRAAAHAMPLADQLGVAAQGSGTWWAPADGTLACAVRDVVRFVLGLAAFLLIVLSAPAAELAVAWLTGGAR